MRYQVITGNNIDTLKQYPDNHFDSIITDPPYGIEFLGKDWDSNTGATELGYEYTGCELDPDYADIARRRIEAWYHKTDISGSELPPEWFDETD